MIEIKVTTREKAREKCNDNTDCVRMAAKTIVEWGGERDIVKHELVSILEAFERDIELSFIWHEALVEHISNLERRDT